MFLSNVSFERCVQAGPVFVKTYDVCYVNGARTRFFFSDKTPTLFAAYPALLLICQSTRQRTKLIHLFYLLPSQMIYVAF